MNEWELTDEEILKASQVEMILPDGTLNPDQGYLTGRVQVAHEAQKKLIEYIMKMGSRSSTFHYDRGRFVIDDLEDWDDFCSIITGGEE